MVKKLTKKEIAVRKKCRAVCNKNNKEDSITAIKKEYPGCSVLIDMTPLDRGMKMFMGLILWRNVDVSF